MTELEGITLKRPSLEDGMGVYRMVENSPPLDTNSSYCNLLQCSHFAETSLVAKRDGELVGFVSAYIVPDRPDVLFVWQVAVAKAGRGLGLASRMLGSILDRARCADIQYMETTITQDNKASWALFEAFAKARSTDLTSSAWMDRDTHFSGLHDSETLVRLGPFTPSQQFKR